ncbi:MAG TPA: hypothetical protein VH475_04830 [Tepidisphaeraceae bacterium]|jgi:hypothetical protein
MTNDPTHPSGPPQPPPGTIDLPLPAAANVPTSFSTTGAAAATAPHASAPSDDEPPHGHPDRLVGPRRQWVITIGIAATVFISLISIALLYYKWAKNDAHDVAIIVWAGDDKSWDGATVTVTGSALPGGLSHVLREDEHLMVRFHVPTGDYRVRVVAKGGRTLAERASDPRRPLRSHVIWWPFHAPPAATQLGFQ